MTNYIQPGNSITVAAPLGGVTSGDLVVIGSLIGVAADTAAAGVDVEIATEGVFDLPKKTAADAIDAGDIVYADSGVTKTGTGSKPLVGVCIKASGSGAPTARVKLGVHGLTGAAGQ